jgi:hypothetical protein
MSHSHCMRLITTILFVCFAMGTFYPSHPSLASESSAGLGKIYEAVALGTSASPIVDGRGPSTTRDETLDLHSNGAVLANFPLYFVKNHGQLDQRVAYYVLGGSTQVFFTQDGVTFVFSKPVQAVSMVPSIKASQLQEESTFANSTSGVGQLNNTSFESSRENKAVNRWAIMLNFVGAKSVTPVGEVQNTATVSYFTNSRDEWNTAVPTYQEVLYRELWPGIDLIFHGQTGQLKYDFIVHPGSDPHQIALQYQGAQNVSLNAGGDLEISTPLGGFTDQAPSSWQIGKTGKQQVPASFTITDTVKGGKYTSSYEAVKFGFVIGPYDRTTDLVIDPAVIVQCGYIGGQYSDAVRDIALDADGNIYITGETESDETSFPVTVGPDLAFYFGVDVFVAKVSSTGTDLIYAGYIGGLGNEYSWGIAVDGDGSAYVAGYTTSAEDTFPLIVGPDLTKNSYYDGFVSKINPAGTALLYSGFVGGGGDDAAYDIAVDESGSAFLAGKTGSTDFPVVGGPDLDFNGINDAFIAKLTPDGSGFIYAGFIGGSDWDWGYRVAVDEDGYAYVAGDTLSDPNLEKFPVLIGPDLTYNGAWDSFVAKVNPSGTALVYSGYLGGNNDELTWGIALDPEGNIYISGETASSEATFPVSVGPDLTYNGGEKDAFVAKVLEDGTALAYCGYIGGDSGDWAYGLSVDSEGEAYIAGFSSSNQNTFPRINGPDGSYNGGSSDAFISKVDHLGTHLIYSGYIGGAGSDYGLAITVDGAGNAFIAGQTSSNQASFPALHWFDVTQNGNFDGFVAKVSVLFQDFVPITRK